MLSRNLRDLYVSTLPDPQNALDLFDGEWSSRFPPPFSDLKAGGIPLFQDSRIIWALQQLGGCEGQNVLELGPLEAGHSYMLEQSGARSITAIEANSHAFLKCLIAKEILGLKRVRFLFGDFVQYLQAASDSYDLLVASGVLYHMREPQTFIELLAMHANRLYLWTHYYDKEIISQDSNLRPKFREHVKSSKGAFSCTLHRQEYQGSLHTKGFCGGPAEYSYWMERGDILEALARGGFKDITIGHEQLNHPHGPCFALTATR